jgi:protoheme IX farnesyltransferase
MKIEETLSTSSLSSADLAGVSHYRVIMELAKARLSLLVTFSSAFGYALGTAGRVDWLVLIALVAGGFFISASAGSINQILERDLDGLMSRTKKRPLPTGMVSISYAVWTAVVFLLLGTVLLLVYTNILATFLALLSFVLYSFVYTPLKRVGPIAVFVGAIPGAMPPLLGWVAATGSISHEALIIFGIQFIWQFPHFWAIAWVSAEDYAKAGFRLLPSGGGKDLNTAFQIMIYTLFLLPLGLLPSYFGITGINSAVVATVCGVLFLATTLNLMRDYSKKSALWIMFGSFIYLPVVQVAYLLDMI